MRLRFLVVSLAVLAFTAGTGFAQTFTGTVDGYWSYNSITPHNAGGSCDPANGATTPCNKYRAFDIQDQSFALNYGELSVEYKPNQVGLRVDFGFGDAAEIVNNNSSDSEFLRHIQQAYLTGTHGKFTVDFGKFVTPIGAEVIETKDNWNYSRGLLFTWAIPFYHFGGRGTYVINDKATISGYVVNGWNNVRDNNTAKSVGFSGNFKPMKKLGLITNVLWGKEVTGSDDPRTLLDGILTYTLNDKVSFMANYDYVQDHLAPSLVGQSGPRVFVQGIAGYIKTKPVDKLTLSARYEWLGDHNCVVTGCSAPSQDLQSYTGTVSVPWNDLTLWGEFRRDTSDVASFTKWSQGVFGPTASQVQGQNTVTLGVTYAFTKMVK
jgi:hypothetical protein